MAFWRSGAVVAVASALVVGWVNIQRHVEMFTGSHLAAHSSVVTYYVSPTGRDSASGTSPRTAWRTLARASRAVLRPGNRLLLQGGRRFSGQLTLSRSDGGSLTTPVLIGSYGTGRATIVSSSDGVLVHDATGVTISRLVIIGRAAMKPRNAGILLYSDLSGHAASHITISHVNVSGFGSGILIGALHDNAGFRHVSITRSVLNGNLDAGLQSYGPAFNPAAPRYANANIYVSHVRAFGNLGDPNDITHNSGNGIVLGSVRNARVIWSSAHGNGGHGGARHEGPEGIWAYNSTGIVIAHDVAYGNTTRSVADGGGFGLDVNTSHSILEYDLSYRNRGPGFLVFNTSRFPQSGNIVRFNISFDDAHGAGPRGGITVAGSIRSAVYQNTVVMAQSSLLPALRISGQPHGVRVFNNLFDTLSGGPLVRAVHSYNRSNVLLAGNDYRVAAGNWNVIWGLGRYDSLATWQAATGQEHVGGRHTGLTLAPSFVGPVSGSAKGGAGFMLSSGSRLRHAGLDLRLLFGLRPGRVDFGGRPYSVISPSIGAW